MCGGVTKLGTMDTLVVGDTVYRLLDDAGFAATVVAIDRDAGTVELNFDDDGAIEAHVPFAEVSLTNPAAAAAAVGLVAGDGAAGAPPADAPLLPPAHTSDVRGESAAGVAGVAPQLPPPTAYASTSTTTAPKTLTLSQMMAQLSERIAAFAEEQQRLTHEFTVAHGQREELTAEVRRSRERVQEQEVRSESDGVSVCMCMRMCGSV